MGIAAIPATLFAVMRRRRAMRPRRTLQDWIALTIARGLSFAVVGGLVYVTYIVEKTGFDDFRKCNKSSTITQIEWGLGVRPLEDCRRL
jgi:drug/metabolite transporter (DMT)-like permease